jgi:beta-glucosidase
LKPGERNTIAFKINHTHLSFYDEKQRSWVVEPGEFELLVGGSSRDIRLKDQFVFK